MNSSKDIINTVKEVFNSEIETLERAKETIGPEYYTASEKIIQSKKVIVSGVGKSGLIGRKIAAVFSSIGSPSVFLHPVDALHGDIGIASEGDTAILLSKSGGTDDIVNLLPYLKARGVYTIAITGNKNSYLYRESDLALLANAPREACPLNITPTNSATLSLVIGDALAVCVMKMKNITLQDFSKQHPLGQIGRNSLLTAAGVMHKGDKLPIIKSAARFKEAIIEISSKKLGCVCVASESGKLEGIITDGDVRRAFQNFDDIRGLSVEDVMTKNPVSISENTLLGEALSLMEHRESQISALPVLGESGKVAGLLRIHDIIRTGLA